MTTTWNVRVRLRQDTAMAGRPVSGSSAQLEQHISGATLRGALAAAWIDAYGTPSSSPNRDEFIGIFEGGVTFEPLFAYQPPLPLSVVTHKRDPGWDCVSETDRARGEKCPCDNPTEPSKGKLPKPASTGQRLRTSSRSHVEIRPDGTAEDGQLFNRAVIRSRIKDAPDAGGTEVESMGQVTGDEALLRRLSEFTRIRIGGKRSTHGAATVDWAHTATSLNRVERMGSDKLILRLASPGIFVDAFGRARSAPSREELTEALGVGAHVDQAWTRWTSVGGWHAASGLPKPEERCVSAGSTYVVAIDGPVSDQALELLSTRGMGLRRHEGFGTLASPPMLQRWFEDAQKWRKDRSLKFAWGKVELERMPAAAFSRITTSLRERAAVLRSGESPAQGLFDSIASDPSGGVPDLARSVLEVKNPHELTHLADWLEEKQ